MALDSRSSVSNLAVADRIEPELRGFEVERIDYQDAAGVAKRVLVAHRGGAGGIAFSGHMDTVPETGWQDDPWSGRIDADGVLHGLGSTDMKGPVAAAIVAARGLPDAVPVTLLITTDEETTKQGARVIAEQSALVRAVRPAGILVVEPTRMQPVRGHRSHILFTCVAAGVQAHSAKGTGPQRQLGADPVPGRDEDPVRPAADRPRRCRMTPTIRRSATSTWSSTTTAPRSTSPFRWRRRGSSSATPPRSTRRRSASRCARRRARHGVTVTEAEEGCPPELPADHPFVRHCVEVAGQARDDGAVRHRCVDPADDRALRGDGARRYRRRAQARRGGRLADLAAAVPVFQALALRLAP